MPALRDELGDLLFPVVFYARLAKETGTFDLGDAVDAICDKIAEELEEFEEAVGTRDPAQVEEEFGDLLFAIVNLARHLDVDAEKALMNANLKFERRFADMEKAIRASGQRLRDHNLESLDREWRAAKRRLS
jgi:uncharacterized protein YabN with tetrapyrrole methylase and pyrophosphatase domain